ncbi:hypothetical protein HanIR_Chr07g0317211 [Helianthus annuus]|nr:hypothetical protein HanIR_Chr07g0317211 [Helianthus annuus]
MFSSFNRVKDLNLRASTMKEEGKSQPCMIKDVNAETDKSMLGKRYLAEEAEGDSDKLTTLITKSYTPF